MLCWAKQHLIKCDTQKVEKIPFSMFCKPPLRLAVIQVDWKARRCTWSPRTSFTTRNSQPETPPLQINRTAPGAQASLPPAPAKQRRGRRRITVGKTHNTLFFFYSSVCKSCADIFCGVFFVVLQKGSNINLIQPQSLWIKPTVQRPKWPPAMGTVLSIGANLLHFYPSKQGVTCTRFTYLRR